MSPARMAKIESAVRIVLALVEARNRQNAAAVSALLAEDCVLEDQAGNTHTGKTAISALLAGSPPGHLEIEEISGMGLRCLLRWRETAGQTRGLDVLQVQDGLICNITSYVKTSSFITGDP